MGLYKLLATGGVGVMPDTSDLRDKSESQLIEYATRMRRERDEARDAIERLRAKETDLKERIRQVQLRLHRKSDPDYSLIQELTDCAEIIEELTS